MTRPVVRRAAPADAPAVAALQVRARRAAYRGLLADDFLDDLAEDAWLEHWTDVLDPPPRPGVHRLVSTDVRGDRPVGVAVGGPVPRRRPA